MYFENFQKIITNDYIENKKILFSNQSTTIKQYNSYQYFFINKYFSYIMFSNLKFYSNSLFFWVKYYNSLLNLNQVVTIESILVFGNTQLKKYKF